MVSFMKFVKQSQCQQRHFLSLLIMYLILLRKACLHKKHLVVFLLKKVTSFVYSSEFFLKIS